jgi:Cu(I)/Ag(I) efflux system membrane fusion protein
MNMKKYIAYIGILILGLILGAVFFGNPNEEETHSHEKIANETQMWTCSMHPQIMQPEAGDCPICGMDLIPSMTVDDGLSADQFKLSKNALALANVQTTVVGGDSNASNTIKLSGSIAENEETNSVQVSYFAGRIEKLNVNATGVQVKKGQLLASIYSPELMAAQQELITASSLKKSQPALYSAVRNKLKLWKLSEAQIDQIETSKIVKENFDVYATVTGTVLKKLVEQGDYVKQGQPLFKIADLSTVWAIFDVYENQVELFQKGQDITIVSQAYPENIYKAKVSFIDPILDQASRTIKLRAVLNNSQNIFKPGMFIEGNLIGESSNNNEALSIPATAILWTGERSVVYIKPNPKEPVFEMREVQLGKYFGSNYEVLQGLNSGDEIVTNGTFTIDAAAQLQGKKSMMNKEGTPVVTGHEGHDHNQVNSQNTKSNESPAHQRVVVDQDFKQQLQLVFEAYIGTKEALVKDDNNSVQQNAKLLIKNLDKVDMKLLADPGTHQHWMLAEKQMRTSANAIGASDDIKVQRSHFKELSTAITSAVQMYGIGQVVYNQFCPMADDNKGAYWLSNDKNVLNPYFGSAMLACGSVKQIIEE